MKHIIDIITVIIISIILIIATVFFSSCSELEHIPSKAYCKWEIIYPDTTIQYQDTLVFSHIVEYVNVGSHYGTNYICMDNTCIQPESIFPVSSTCPIRIIEYKVLK